jgi:hypothetical protein
MKNFYISLHSLCGSSVECTTIRHIFGPYASRKEAQKQEDRADNLETKYENLLSHIENVVGDGWDGASAEEIQAYLRYYAIKDKE